MTSPRLRSRSDFPFLFGLAVIGGLYVFLIVAMLAADAAYLASDVDASGQTGVGHAASRLVKPLAKPEIRYAIRLSLAACGITAILSVWVAVPVGYLMSRFQLPSKGRITVII